ncbi:MAG: MBL fold metallo-hydrolase [Betaproteobacteria bacterium]|nr:MBL fold metallo-hydrolase [Betaproteobacteria bacterium]
MKRFIPFLCAALLALPALADKMPEPKVVKVNERVYALLGPVALPNKHNQGYTVNSTLIVGDTGAILIDTGFTDEVGAHLAKAIAKLTPKPVTHIVNTHHHGDHTFGNVAFPQAKVISSEMCRKLLIEGEADWLAMVEGLVGRKFPNTRAVPATEVYAKNSRRQVTLDGVKLEFWVPEAAHTAGDMLIWLPDDKVLIGGDVLVNQVTPNFRDATVKQWIATLAEVKKIPAKTIVPGHGPLMTSKDAAAMHARMAKLYAGVEAGYKAGLSDSEIRKQLDLSEWKKLHHFEQQMGGNINKAYLEVEAAAF